MITKLFTKQIDRLISLLYKKIKGYQNAYNSSVPNFGAIIH